MDTNIEFYYINEHGKKSFITSSKEDSKHVARALLEGSHSNDIGTIYIKNKWGDWEILDYYNTII